MPSRDLLLLRHAKSSWDSEAQTDFERPLAKRGRKDCPRLGAWLAERDALPDRVVCSPALRARETACGVLEASGGDPETILYDERLYGCNAQTVLRIVMETPAECRRVMIVGHFPALEDVAIHLGKESLTEPENGKIYPTGTISWFRGEGDWVEAFRKEVEFIDLVRPRTLRES